MALTCIEQTALHCVGGSSDKLYVVQVQKEDLGAAGAEYLTVGYYGRRGASLNRTQKYRGPSIASARAAAEKLIREKTRNGYGGLSLPAGAAIPGMPSDAPVPSGIILPGGGPVGATSTPSPVVGPIPMLAQTVHGDEHVQDLMEDPRWAMQRKYDGERVTISIRRSGIQAYNRKGQARSLTAAVEAELKPLLAKPDFKDERETVLDGELMGDVFVAFNLITLRDVDVRMLCFDERYSALEELLVDHQGLLAPVAWSAAEKSAMLDQALTEGWEGVMFLDIEGVYTPSRSPALLKHKLWATCTCRVLTVNTKRSIQIALLDDEGVEQFAGNVTVPVNMDLPEPDDLVEVRYLYALEGGSLYQPTLLRIRTDIDEADLRSSIRIAPPERRGVAL